MGQDGLAEPDDAGKGILSRPHHGEQVVPDLFLDAAVRVAAGAKLSEGGRDWGTCVMLAVLLHYSTVCRNRTSSHLPPPCGRAPYLQRSGTLLSRGNNTRHGQ